MTHYSNKPGSVRVDFFLPTGKWKYTFQVDMGPFYHEPLIHNALRKALDLDGQLGRAVRRQVEPDRTDPGDVVSWWQTWEGSIVVLEPYHNHAHPIMLLPAFE